MSVNGLLEGYLTVYGWEVYGAIFLLLVAIGAVLYPVARVLFDIAIAYAEGGSTPETSARSLIVRLCIYLLVLVLGLLPLAPVDVNSTTVQNRCGREALTLFGERYPALEGGDYGFAQVKRAYAPLLPYLTMLIASGFNAVLYQAIPCLHDLTNLNLAMNTLNFSAAENPNELKSSVERFERECGGEARRMAYAILDGAHGPDMRLYLEERMAAYADTLPQRQKQLIYPASKFYQEVFYKACTGAADRTTPAGRLCTMGPWRAQQPVAGFPYDPVRDSDASQYQANTGQGMPTCDEWWNDSEHGLYQQLVEAGGKSLEKNMMALKWEPGMSMIDHMKVMVNGEEAAVEQMLLAGKRQLSSKIPEMGWKEGAWTAGLFAFTDVAQNIASQAGGYLMTMYFMKIGTSLLQPFVLMTVFMLWGVFLIIGEMRGMSLIKGMLLIFVLSILPSLWSFADYIDDQLFLVLYPGAPAIGFENITDELMTEHSTVERLLLMFVTLVFYVIFPLLMLYLVAEAGGPGQGTGMVSQGINSPAQAQGGVAGSSVSGSSVRPGVKSWVSGKFGGGKKSP